MEYVIRFSYTGVSHRFQMQGDSIWGRSVCGMVRLSNSTEKCGRPTTECICCLRKIKVLPPPARKPRKTPYQKIRDAAENVTSCYLTERDVVRLAYDQAIIQRAELDDAGEE